MPTFMLPRYRPRLFVEVTIVDEGDGEGNPTFWFANFNSLSVFTVGWPLATGKRRQVLGPLGLPTVRVR